ncbi:Hpa2 protein [Desulfurella amilsii]|uniref:Hpa2 protein n=1 Tax=Desulfurella amilsii TaxID=1562698 RepID=A0A1X4XYF1_9BACT|nr:lytic transglycosylase domain-containing protein [Desulfurella amilsii]OSS42543.1 Hpa2 protein [Desulfurella amilsii]
MKRIFFIIALLLVFFQFSFAETPSVTNANQSTMGTLDSKLQYVDTFNQIGQKYGINPYLLYSLAVHESTLNPRAVNHNSDGSTDYGLMQINTTNFGGLGLNLGNVFDIPTNINAGARVLAGCMSKFGNNWIAVDCYNKGYDRSKLSENNLYVKQVQKVYNQLTTTGTLGDLTKYGKDGGSGPGNSNVISDQIKQNRQIIAIIFITMIIIIIIIIIIILAVTGILPAVIAFLAKLYKVYKVANKVRKKLKEKNKV